MKYVDLETARTARGLRLVVLAGVPSPWSEAAKGIFRIKGIDHVAVRCGLRDEEVRSWTRTHNAPVALYDDEPPRSNWADILALAERLDEKVPLLPAEAERRALVLGLSHEICGESGLVWSGRVMTIGVSLASEGTRGFPVPVAKYLARKYGYAPERVAGARRRLQDVLGALAAQLRRGRDLGGPYLFGEALTAADVYSATALAPFAPLPEELCPMPAPVRAALESGSAEVRELVPAELFEHRDLVYRRHLELPVEL